MSKLVGFTEMKKCKGKVLYLVGGNATVGQSVSTEFVYDDLADKIISNDIGKEIIFGYGRGYSGKAYVSDITVK